METEKPSLLPHINKDIVKGIRGFKLDAYLIALEGWRRGLTLKWYKDQSPLCEIHTFRGSTHDKCFSLESIERKHFFYRSRGDKVDNRTVNICQSKYKTNTIIKKQGISTPEDDVFNLNGANAVNIKTFAEKVGFPVIIKPLSGSMGRGVYTDIKNQEELEKCLEDYMSRYKYKKVIVQKHYFGEEYRVYVVGDRVVGATNRVPANVVGDGVNNVAQLIDLKNTERKKNPYLASKPIKIDYEVHQLLKNVGYDLDSIPKKDEIVMLRKKSNLSSGGDPIDATNELSPEIKRLAVDTLKALPNIPHAGVDIIVNPEEKDRGVVLEVNATAEIAFHMFPLRGNSRDLPKAIIDYYFPETKNIKRNLLYFDYISILEPLKTWAVEELKVIDNSQTLFYGKKYVISGKVRNVGYMNWIKRQALKNDFHGYVKKIKNNKLEVAVFGPNKERIEEFKKTCYKGSKNSEVKHVDEKTLYPNNKLSLKLGFETLL